MISQDHEDMSYEPRRDVIPVEDLQDGIQLCRRNVDQLLEDASILYKSGSYGHAQALAILAM